MNHIFEDIVNKYLKDKILLDAHQHQSLAPFIEEKKDVKCECGSDTAGIPYHSSYCPKDEKGSASKQTPPEDML